MNQTIYNKAGNAGIIISENMKNGCEKCVGVFNPLTGNAVYPDQLIITVQAQARFQTPNC